MLFASTAVTALAVGQAQTAAPAPIAVMSSFGHSVLANNGPCTSNVSNGNSL